MTTYQKGKTYTTKNKYPFYGVAGENAFAVYGDYQEAHAMRNEYSKFKIKGFRSYEEAEELEEPVMEQEVSKESDRNNKNEEEVLINVPIREKEKDVPVWSYSWLSYCLCWELLL